MAKKKPLETYKAGDKVKVNRGGSGNGIQFLTIKDGFVTDNCNGYKDYNFEELDEKIKMSEYDIRPISQSDLKLKKLFEEHKADEFEFDYDDINRSFWESQKDNIKKSRNYIDNVLHPYLTEYKNVLSVEEMVNWDTYYKKGMHTKSRYIFIIPHPHLNIIVFQGTGYIDMIITAPEELESPKRSRKLHLFSLGAEYTDEKYVDVIKEVTKLIIADFEKGMQKHYCSYHINPDYKLLKKLKVYKHIGLHGDYNDYQNMPSSHYVYVLRELNYLKHYAFNKGFE